MKKALKKPLLISGKLAYALGAQLFADLMNGAIPIEEAKSALKNLALQNKRMAEVLKESNGRAVIESAKQVEEQLLIQGFDFQLSTGEFVMMLAQRPCYLVSIFLDSDKMCAALSKGQDEIGRWVLVELPADLINAIKDAQAVADAYTL